MMNHALTVKVGVHPLHKIIHQDVENYVSHFLNRFIVNRIMPKEVRYHEWNQQARSQFKPSGKERQVTLVQARPTKVAVEVQLFHRNAFMRSAFMWIDTVGKSYNITRNRRSDNFHWKTVNKTSSPYCVTQTKRCVKIHFMLIKPPSKNNVNLELKLFYYA
ncbi:hypothetical protein Tcan_10966 [Toxocara canis]|uniref:Uncharacterized protein n=1 Tax=Toxocara canis TaxID=6265 RepID=A0A0B2V042_TOXCA|nr:hypothetical protein Tcan_10966 [Toxocara canis]